MTDPFAMHSIPDDVERITHVRMMDQALTEGHAPAVAAYEATKRRVREIVEQMA